MYNFEEFLDLCRFILKVILEFKKPAALFPS